MNRLDEHKTKIKGVVDALQREIHEGDIIKFLYNNEEKIALVLNPRYEGMMHGVSLENIDQTMLMNLLETVSRGNPQLVYFSSLSKQPAFKKADAYRTYDIAKISDIKIAAYDLGFYTKNLNSLLVMNKGLLVGYSDSEVFIRTNLELLPYMKLRANKEGIYTDTPIPKMVLDYLKLIPKPKFVTTWAIKRSAEISDENFQLLQLQHFKKLTVRGGIFFLPENTMVELKQAGAKLL